MYFVLIVVLTVGATSVVTVVLGAREARSRVFGQLRSVLTLKEQEISSWADGLALNLDIVLSQQNIEQDLRTLSQEPPSTTSYLNAYSRVQSHFNWAARRMGLFEEVFFMDPDGTVRVSTATSHENQRLGLNEFFTEGMKGAYIQQPSYSLTLGKMTLVASRPVQLGGEVLGVLAGRAGLAGLNHIMLERAGLGETGETYLVGMNRRLLTDVRRPGHPIPETYVRTQAADVALDGRGQGSGSYPGYNGARVIGVYDWIPELKVALIAEQEEAEALSASRTLLITTSGVAVLAVLLAVLASGLMTRSIVRPLADLADTAARITSGDLDLRAHVEREDEIGTVGRAFNRMTAQLSDVVRSLEKRTDHLRAINEVGRHISSILELEELLPYVAQSLLDTFHYEVVRILLLNGAGTHGRLFTCGGEDCAETVGVYVVDLPDGRLLEMVARDGQPRLMGTTGAQPSQLAVPLRVADSVVGVMEISARPPHLLDDQDLFAAQTLADQLAIAMENSRLYRQAHELAAGRERQRLARDLHDAVSQTLFSASLLAEVLPRIYERDPEMGRQRLEELRQLTRGALAEMRTLLLELRPGALMEANLPDLLQQLAEAVTGRARIPVDLDTEGCGDLPADVRVALYRIAQEALNNVVKHAGASRARVALHCNELGIRLEVADDGVGFDPESSGAGQLGLGIMRERAEAVGAELEVESSPGRGCRVVLTWSPPT